MADLKKSTGVVYTETTVWSAPSRFAEQAPYQIGIVDLKQGGRITVRLLSKDPDVRAQIGDQVEFLEERDGTPFFQLRA